MGGTLTMKKISGCLVMLFCLMLSIATSADLQDKDKKEQDDHPKHQMTVWTTRYKKTVFRVIKLPRCEHLEIVFTYCLPGETKEQAKKRLNGVTACTGCFYNPAELRPVDFFRRNGQKIVGKEQGRCFLATFPDGRIELSKDYRLLENQEIDALALGQMLVPFSYDGFNDYFANIQTDRMALGFSKKHLYIIQGKTSLWKLTKFIQEKLYCDLAINTDGGHAVKGYSPFHLVFRWQKANSPDQKPAKEN